jgi:hypothetical protein
MFDDEFIQAIDADDPDMPLDSADPEFVRGVEVGIIMQSLILGFPLHMRMHVSNAEMCMRLATYHEYTFSAEDTDDVDMVVVSLMPPEEEYED